MCKQEGKEEQKGNPLGLGWLTKTLKAAKKKKQKRRAWPLMQQQDGKKSSLTGILKPSLTGGPSASLLQQYGGMFFISYLENANFLVVPETYF